MEQRTVGNSDLVVSLIGMGCNNFSRAGSATETYEGSARVIHAAVDAGITFFDGADIYGSVQGRSEEYLGRALAGRRDAVVLSTKFGYPTSQLSGEQDWGPRGSATYVRKAVEASLRRLNTDTIDLLQFHHPDPETPIGVTLAALTALVEEGKVRYIGQSNFTAAQTREADRVSRENGFARFISAQNEYSLLERSPEAGLLGAVADLGMGFFPYYPLAAGLLTGKYSPSGGEGRLTLTNNPRLADADWGRLAQYREVCEQAGASPSEVALAWLASRSVVSSVIAGATRVEQVHQNTAAAEVRLSPATLAGLDEVFAPAA
ncbi:MAG: aldo/keto reductase [Propioniciclava sp.]